MTENHKDYQVLEGNQGNEDSAKRVKDNADE
jgi:hypothetical protein